MPYIRDKPQPQRTEIEMEFIERKEGDEYVNYKPKGKGKKRETRFPFDGLESTDGQWAIGELIRYVPYSRKPRRVMSRDWRCFYFHTQGGHRWVQGLCGAWDTMEEARIALEKYDEEYKLWVLWGEMKSDLYNFSHKSWDDERGISRGNYIYKSKNSPWQMEWGCSGMWENGESSNRRDFGPRSDYDYKVWGYGISKDSPELYKSFPEAHARIKELRAKLRGE